MLPVTTVNAGGAGRKVPVSALLASQIQQSTLWAVDDGWIDLMTDV